jgi:hypothetical protein
MSYTAIPESTEYLHPLDNEFNSSIPGNIELPDILEKLEDLKKDLERPTIVISLNKQDTGQIKVDDALIEKHIEAVAILDLYQEMHTEYKVTLPHFIQHTDDPRTDNDDVMRKFYHEVQGRGYQKLEPIIPSIYRKIILDKKETLRATRAMIDFVKSLTATEEYIKTTERINTALQSTQKQLEDINKKIQYVEQIKKAVIENEQNFQKMIVLGQILVGNDIQGINSVNDTIKQSTAKILSILPIQSIQNKAAALNGLKKLLTEQQARIKSPIQDLYCPVCISSITADKFMFNVACGHTICSACATQLKTTPFSVCPTCRATFDVKPLYITVASATPIANNVDGIAGSAGVTVSIDSVGSVGSTVSVGPIGSDDSTVSVGSAGILNTNQSGLLTIW